MVAAIGAVAGVAGAAISAGGARSAANTQADASAQAQQMQMMAAAQQRADLAPWTQAGGAAQSRLNQYLGIGGVGSSGTTSLGLATGLTPDQVRQQLLSRYTKQNTASGNAGPLYANGQEAINALGEGGAHNYFQELAKKNDNSYLWTSGDRTNPGTDGQRIYPAQAQQSGPTSTVDEEGLNAAIAKYYEEQNAQNAEAAADPTYGSLLRAYRNGEEFDSGPAFSFTGENLSTDPGYQFGLNQGTQGIERGQASRGNFLSGAAMKELDRFNQDYAGTKFNDAFNRASSTYTTNLNRRQNEWNTNLNAYDNNRSRIYSFLTGVSTLGQNSAAQVGAGNQQAANNSSNALMQGANAVAAGQVASGNAIQSGINSAANSINSAGGWNALLSGSRGTTNQGFPAYSGGASGNSLNAYGSQYTPYDF